MGARYGKHEVHLKNNGVRELRYFIFYDRGQSEGHQTSSESRSTMSYTSHFSVTAKLGNKDLVGNALWVLKGEGNPRQYFLCGIFIVERLIPTVSPKGRYLLEGKDGIVFETPVRIDGYEWFKPFMKSQSNFSMGVREIRESNFIEQMKSVAQTERNWNASCLERTA